MTPRWSLVVMLSVVAGGIPAAARGDDLPKPPRGSIQLPPEKEPPQLPPLAWEWSKFGTADYVFTGSAAAITLAAAIVPPRSTHTFGGILFDGDVRQGLRADSVNRRYIARDASDVGLSLAATWPVFVDSLITAWWYRGSREVAQETALIDLETLAITGAVQGVTNVFVSRERPYGRNCGGIVPENTVDCSGTGRFRSFFSGHAAFSFASASLVCTHHFELGLLGAPYDALSCALGYAVASTTAALRVVGDMHYASDVITGALVGTLIGYGVPYLHYRHKHVGSFQVGDVRLQLVPFAGGGGIAGVF